MSWAKLDDRAYTHPKFLGLDPAAIALWVFGLSYVANIESDGFIPRPQVPILGAVFKASPARSFRLATELVGRGLWDEEAPVGYKVVRELGPGFWIHDYLKHNPSRERLEERREQEAEKKRNQRARPHGTDLGTPGGSPAAPDPTRPVPTQEKTEHGSRPPAARRADSLNSSGDAEQKRSDTVTDTPAGQAIQVFEAYCRGFKAFYGQTPPDKTPQDLRNLCRLIDHYGAEKSLELVPFYFETPDKFVDARGHPIELFYASMTIHRLVAARARKLGIVK